VQANTAYPWSAPLIELLSVLPPEETTALFRRQWGNMALRDRLVLELAQKTRSRRPGQIPVGLASADLKAASASLAALLVLPRDGTTRPLVPAMRLLRALLDQPKEETLRTDVLKLVTRETTQPAETGGRRR